MLKKIIYFIILYFAIPATHANCQVDTINLYLEDTSYYYYTGPLEFWKFKTKVDSNSARQYMRSTGVNYFFKDSLPDGYYKLYNLNKRDSLNKGKENFLVLEGCFINNLRQGLFKYWDSWKKGTTLKIVPFKDGIAHGKVIEFSHNKIQYISEYKNGIKDGFFLLQEIRWPLIQINYYKEGKHIDYETFERDY